MFGIDFAQIGESIARVLAVGLILGAGLPALFAVGMRLVSEGEGDVDAQTGVAHKKSPALTAVGYLLYAFVALVILAGILWITRQTLFHHFGWQIFPKSTYK
ncbi:MAG: hypothetical protein QM774_13195 [Gordonia sp. (in: high G+C Gram-positive bacteria)]|uniref:hypothetical protein n=1 Tax=Gordonia sp. (in: high G+C Gram-positive bacteria) TaxID=84139 RepID=UPI0039E479FE